jgi:hypothetical protein
MVSFLECSIFVILRSMEEERTELIIIKHLLRRAPEGDKALNLTASHGFESPETKVSKPMETRRRAASRAGGLRSVGGSGQMGTCVASGNHPKTWVVIFFLRGGFLPPATQRLIIIIHLLGLAAEGYLTAPDNGA